MRIRAPLILALFAGLVLATIPAHAQSVPSGIRWHGDDQAVITAMGDQLRATGWQDVRYVQTAPPNPKDNIKASPAEQAAAVASAPTTWHQDGYFAATSPGWYNTSNGRTYTIWAAAYMDHSQDEGNQWRVRLETQCRRTYSGTTVGNPCDWFLGTFQALGWDSFSNSPQYVYGSKNLPNTTCAINSGGVGSWRTVDTLYPYKMSFIGAVIVDFRDANCTVNYHTSQSRSFGSQNARMTENNHANAPEPDWTGWN